MRRFRCHRTPRNQISYSYSGKEKLLFTIYLYIYIYFFFFFKVPALKTLTKQRKPRMSLLYETRLMRLYCKLSAQHNMNYLSYLCVCVCVCVCVCLRKGWVNQDEGRPWRRDVALAPRARSTVRVVSSQHTAIIRTAAGPLQSHTLTAISKTPSVSSNTCHLLSRLTPLPLTIKVALYCFYSSMLVYRARMFQWFIMSTSCNCFFLNI